jgi:peptidoglycan/xylan/chitin deacetylase (PgdA/CDA1 family)
MLRSFARPFVKALIDAKFRIQNRIDPPVVVLLYHRVADVGTDPDMLAVTPARFREQLSWLKLRFPVLRFEEEWTDHDKPAVVITFDDGYADNYHFALPILGEFDIPATFFVTSGQLDSGEEFWWDELARLLSGACAAAPQVEFPRESGTIRLDVSTAPARQAAYRTAHRHLMDAPPDLRRRMLAAVREWYGSDGAARASHRILSSSELTELAAHPLATIGAHTVSHARLSVLDFESQRWEIVASKADLEARIGKLVEVFAYPFGGRQDYTRDTVKLCQEAGFRKVASNFPGNAHRWSDPLQIPRHLVRNWSVDEFAKRIEGFFAR